MIRVLVVDDHPMVRTGVIAMLRGSVDIECVGEAADGVEAVRLAEALHCDVALMDLSMPRLDGFEATALLLRRRPQCKVVAMTARADAQDVRQALRCGASGYVLKTSSAAELCSVVRAVHLGRRALCGEATALLDSAVPPAFDVHALTQREREVLAALGEGATNQAIASRLEISVATVKFHVANLLVKLDVATRTEAALLAQKYRIGEGS